MADAIRHELPRVQASLPPGVKLDIAFDESIFVSRSIREAEETLMLAAGLVVIIIFVFLRNLRATIIPGLAIPTSIVATFAIMYFLGFSINNFTLLALTLAIGIVVDDAIIVLENAYRHQEELGQSPEEAATSGTREIAFAVIATTISLVAVFTPLAFLKGSTGRLFNEFGIAVAGSVVVSGFVALTLTPMLCAKMLRVPQRHGVLYRALENGFNALAAGYARTLRAAVRYRWAVVGGVVLLTLGAAVVFRSLKREFVPPEDKGWFFSIIIAPEGSSLAYTDGYQRQAEAVLDKTKDVASYFSVVNIGDGVSRGMIFTNLVDFDQRTRSIQDIIGEVQGGYFAIPGVFAFANNPPAFGFGSPVQFVLQNPDFDLLVKGNDTLLARARQVKGLVNVDSDLRVNKPELTVNFDRDRAEDLGVPVGDVATTLQVLLGGNRTSTFTRNNKQYDVIVQLDPRARATPSDMTGLYVRGRGRELVKLEALASVKEGVGPRELNHFNRVRASTITAGPRPGLHPRRGDRLAEPHRQRGAAEGEQHRARRRVARAGGERLVALLRVPARAARGVHGAGEPVRVAGAPVHRAAGGAARGDGRAVHAQDRGRHAQSVQPDRHDPAHRTGDQEFDPAGGVHQPAQGARPGHHRGGARGRPHPPPADPHDVGRHGHGRGADRLRPRRGVDQPAAARLRHRGWGAVLDAAHAVRGAGGLRHLRRAPGPGGRPVAGRAAPPARHGGGRVILGLLTLLQVSAAPAPQGPVPRVTLNQAIARASRLDPDYVRALGQVDNAEWGRRAALAVLILPSLTASIDATRYSTEFFNVGTGRNQAEAVNATFTAATSCSASASSAT